MNWFSADFHLDHFRIIKYQNRPFKTAKEMNEMIINNTNACVLKNDTLWHLGDFCFGEHQKHLEQINCRRVMLLPGSHDRDIIKARLTTRQIMEIEIDHQLIVMCHYCLRVWPKSHYGTWHLYGHSHGHLPPEGKSWDVGVDNNNFKPLSEKEIFEIMSHRPQNINFVGTKENRLEQNEKRQKENERSDIGKDVRQDRCEC